MLRKIANAENWLLEVIVFRRRSRQFA